jgi:alkanesulfonate monooxygenase SsuD/methylene tetrahydromethanopterin reductase-like flavin-dependent oxidoreductase (luciferase family)
MRFGIFDHLDDSGLPLGRHFEERLKLIEVYDRAGFYGYHLAEHHNTPLGYAPSPGIFLSAAAQRTKQLRFGPMVYLLPLYHPLRLIDEICMLDQMSGGRFMYGVGRGISPVEVGFYGVDFATGGRTVPRSLRRHSYRFDRGRADLSRQVLRFRPRANGDEAVPEALSGALVWARQPGKRSLGGGERR